MSEFQLGHISYAYEDVLNAYFDQEQRDTINILARGWKQAPLAQQEGETLGYVRIGVQEESKPPTLIVPGFTETIVSNAPFITAMVEQGRDVIVPDQNRKDILKNFEGEKDATFTQAVNNFSMLENEGLIGSGVDVVTHSYGSIVFQAMLNIAVTLGYDTFKDAKVVMLSPAGASGKAEQSWALWRRWYGSAFKQNHLVPEYFKKSSYEMMAAAIAVAKANPARTAREIFDLKNKQVDLIKVMDSGIAELCVMGFAEDVLYPHDSIAPAVQAAQNEGKNVSYTVPISYECDDQKNWQRSKTAAIHSDSQFNPRRVAAAVEQVLAG